MPTVNVKPNSDVTKNWTPSTGTDHYVLIDELVSSPNDTDYISTSTLGADDRFGMGDTPANTDTVTQAVFHIRCGITDSSNAAYIACSIYKAGGTQVGSTQNITCGPAADVPNDGTLTNVTKTWSGTGFPLTKAEADGLELKVVFNNV